MKTILTAAAGLAAAFLTGCATVTPPDATTIQGNWQGQEVRDGKMTASFLSLVGSDMEFHASGSPEWYKGTYTINEKAKPKQFTGVITQSPNTADVGKTINGIYELIPGKEEGQGTLILTEYPPGNPNSPADARDPNARQIVFTREP